MTAHVTPQLEYLWSQLSTMEPTSQLGGIYAAKTGYHDTRDQNPPGNYSVVLPEDREGPGDMAAALDWTFPEAQRGDYARIALYSSRLLASGRDPDDERGAVLREFYGQANGDRAVEGWDFYYVRPVTSDSSHLWHIHLSFLRKWVTSKWAMGAVLSILRGETVEYWRAQQSEEEGMTPQQWAVAFNGSSIAYALATGQDTAMIVATWPDPDHGGHIGVPFTSDEYPLSLQPFWARLAKTGSSAPTGPVDLTDGAVAKVTKAVNDNAAARLAQ